MMRYIQSDSTDPYFNLALEQYVFDSLDRRDSYFMLWQNAHAIIIGKHQNTIAEINLPYVTEQKIRVARRLSGGGAVYHDLGNLNFTFIVDQNEAEPFDFATFCRPVAQALAGMGVKVEISGRNDMTIDGKKFSGNSQYSKRGRVMHHGTLLYDSDLQVLGKALRVSKDKIESKGVSSVKSRVTNVRPYLKGDFPIELFRDALRDYMRSENAMQDYSLSPEDKAAVERLRDERYSLWEWNFGRSPAYSLHKTRRVEGCGKIEVFMNVGKAGVLTDLAFFGDYFGNGDSTELAGLLRGRRLEEGELRRALDGVDIGQYFNRLELDSFLALLLQ